MNDKFKNKYRISSTRLQNWDYASEGSYFITICTKDRKHYFGEIVEEKMIMSNIGVIADLMWDEIKNHAKNIDLGEFVVMPNHIHGILILNDVPPTPVVETLHATSENGIIPTVETLHATSLQQTTESQTHKNEQMAKISPKSNSISTIIRGYKSAVTKHCNRLGFEFVWQARFHDHIIRDAQSFNNIQNYIFNNPMNWGQDKFYGD